MEGRIGLVGKMMCEECDAFLGKPHREGCSKHGRLVENADATEKFTTAERAYMEEPLIGLNRETVEMILDGLRPQSEIAAERRDEMKSLREGLGQFVAAAREVEAEAAEEPS